MTKNKKAQTSSWGTILAIVMTLLLLLIGWYLYNQSLEGIDDIDNIANKWLENVGSGIEGDNPCPCSDGNERVQVEGTVYCKANLESSTCNEIGFGYDNDQEACYYTRTQCVQYLASRS